MSRFLFLLFGVVLIGCGVTSVEDYKQTVSSARTSIPHAVEMEELYGDADHFITHFGMDENPLEWQTVVRFGGRYTLSMVVPVDVDYSGKRVTPAGDPVFILNEMSRVTELPDGRMEAHYSGPGNQKEFGEAEWEIVYAHRGDFAKIGIPTDGVPVENFDRFVRAQRESAVRVSLVEKREE